MSGRRETVAQTEPDRLSAALLRAQRRKGAYLTTGEAVALAGSVGIPKRRRRPTIRELVDRGVLLPKSHYLAATRLLGHRDAEPVVRTPVASGVGWWINRPGTGRATFEYRDGEFQLGDAVAIGSSPSRRSRTKPHPQDGDPTCPRSPSEARPRPTRSASGSSA